MRKLIDAVATAATVAIIAVALVTAMTWPPAPASAGTPKNPSVSGVCNSTTGEQLFFEITEDTAVLWRISPPPVHPLAYLEWNPIVEKWHSNPPPGAPMVTFEATDDFAPGVDETYTVTESPGGTTSTGTYSETP